MINKHAPINWKELQNEAAKILEECGFGVEIEKSIHVARGSVEVDVFACDNQQIPSTVFLIECKRWKNSVPKSIVHSFRSVVADFGANWGMIISSRGFQRGAVEAVEFTNVKLVSWVEFESLFENRWYKNFFINELTRNSEALDEYTEEINSRVLNRAEKLDRKNFQKFIKLRKKHLGLASFLLAVRVRKFMPNKMDLKFSLPIKKGQSMLGFMREGSYSLPKELYAIQSYRELLETAIILTEKATLEFDNLFGGRV